ncbi:MAG TPA: hypothetical protein VNM16_02405, partial [Bacillota bacterium]|nr:hypothetical protein [Bacillota bacterium]
CNDLTSLSTGQAPTPLRRTWQGGGLPALADFSAFFGAAAGASAALIGLLFVAMQLEPASLTPTMRARRAALARSTFSI